MRALVLGGNGFIGSHLVDELLRNGHFVRVFDKYPELYREPLSGVDYVLGDFGNRGLVADALDNVDVVYHLISTTHPKTSNDDPMFDVQSNVIETLFLLEQCVKKKIQKFVYTSSGGTVYGVPGNLPIPEDSPTFPLCSYGVTKLCIEKYLEMFYRLYGLDYVVIRPSNPFGPRQNPNNMQGAVGVFIRKALQKSAITIWGDGSIVRDFLFIRDLVEGIYRSSVSNINHRVFNLGSGTGISLNQLITVIDQCLGLKSNVEFTPKRSFDIQEIYLDIDRAKDEFGWQPRISMEVGVALTAEFFENNLSVCHP